VELATAMLTLTRLGSKFTKDGLNLALSAPSLEAQVALEDRQQVIAGSDPAFAERVADFVAKRGAKASKAGL